MKAEVVVEQFKWLARDVDELKKFFDPEAEVLKRGAGTGL
jgi:hypothetical protein